METKDKRTPEQIAEDKAAQESVQQGQTPEDKANEIINDAVEDKLVMVSGTAYQKLETVVRYLNRDKIQARSESWFKSNHDALFTDAVETLIAAREKSITDYLKKKEQSDLDEAFRQLIARGISVQDAYAKVYNKK